ncbi:DUF6979 family protein [Aeromonas hydrophila]|uniref:DUF6979 family protein n=1 Tax=Aeromonas hydrophila TaxID=644 RepID=UPI0011817844|nr:hypothetical protein [Aeromonas hydrophila]HAU4892961.1 hypothetical protein [Aeromonas hydrophila]HAU4973957.1 hypothetical protein [Aeromonas hydrophila]HAU4982858.1 hypothetical protein [Aeromonas hydrophila]
MRYGKAAVDAVSWCKRDGLNPAEAWNLAVQEHLPTHSGQVKGCPKGAFLGLCSDGRVKGIQEGNYTRSTKNRDYAITAVEILKNRMGAPSISANDLWDAVMAKLGSDLTPNHQMEVVLALWKEGLIR